jgi:hypothetical protein
MSEFTLGWPFDLDFLRAYFIMLLAKQSKKCDFEAINTGIEWRRYRKQLKRSAPFPSIMSSEYHRQEGKLLYRVSPHVPRVEVIAPRHGKPHDYHKSEFMLGNRWKHSNSGDGAMRTQNFRNPQKPSHKQWLHS